MTMGSEFIKEYKMWDLSICDNLIQHFKDDPLELVRDGTVGTSAYKAEKSNINKKSKDLSLYPHHTSQYPAIRNYIEDELKRMIDNYIAEFFWAARSQEIGITEGINIQYYKPGDAFYSWHTERSSGQGPSAARNLVFMSYLNDVNEGGETEFFHQELRVKPEKGKTIIWPADWMYAHRGVPALTEEKYIITGWLSYLA